MNKVINLYRELIRASYRFPRKAGIVKVQTNIREIFELYRDEEDPARIRWLIQNGYKDVDFIKSLSEHEEKDLKKLFKEL